MTIAFIHPHKAFLPEVDAYCKFFSDHQINTVVLGPKEIATVEADVEWHFMGTDKGGKKTAVKIHEYASASAPPFNDKKDMIKKIITAKPDYRLFLNEYVRKQFDFKDLVPFGYRDMGIDLSFFQSNNKKEKDFDFIYTGSINKERKILKLIKCFAEGTMRQKSLLILSKDYKWLKNKFKSCKNIFFEGPVSQNEVSDYILRSRFAINFIIDKEPFNQQTSTKFLEYAALKIPIISTEYEWIKKFQIQYGGEYFYLKNDLSNFNWNEIACHPYSFPQLTEWTWEKQIRKSGVLEFLQSTYPELLFT